MSLEILRKLGLSRGEIKIYSALLDSGRSPINKIHEKTGIERRNIYDIVNKLIERGLVSYVQENKKRYFQVSHPSQIIGYIEEKKHDLDETKEEVEKEIPGIMEKYSFKRPIVNGEIFRGDEGIKTVWEDMLNYKNNYWIGSGRYVPLKLPHWFASWNKRRIKKKVKWHNLLRHEMRGKTKQMPFEEIRYLPKEFSGSPTVIGTYGNKTVNFLFGEDYFAFVVENKELADSYRRYHKYLWDNVAEK